MDRLVYSTTVVNAAYPRSKRYSTVRSTDRLQIAVNRYIPLKKDENGLTLIFLHCSGLQKESWEEVIRLLFEQDLPIKEAIAFDWVGHGDSAVLNEGKLGYDLLWSDGSRDLLALIDQLQLPEPIVCLGHSLGGGQSLGACAKRRRQFAGCVGVEAVAYPFPGDSAVSSFASLSAHFPDTFASKQEAIDFLMSIHYKWFNKAVRDRLFDTMLYSPAGSDKIKLKSSSMQLAALFSASPESVGELYTLLPFVDTPVLLISAGDSNWNPSEAPEMLASTLSHCESVTVPKAHHMLIQEIPEVAASIIGPFLTKTLARYNREQAREAAVASDMAEIIDRGFKELVEGLDSLANLSLKLSRSKTAKL
ncbi:Alpha/beta hydrolase family-domain-containing protein [Limtongia smithiae]|uniref:Alpha/beta hydrolase family-domain-containing protein n=1 Tax=Limtongia smithiae TaxID=1125753 RepID=UPI0034CEC130